jgi:hypothetical protein
MSDACARPGCGLPEWNHTVRSDVHREHHAFVAGAAAEKAEGDLTEAKQFGGGSITYVTHCDSCETFKERMVEHMAARDEAIERAERSELDMLPWHNRLTMEYNDALVARDAAVERAEKAERDANSDALGKKWALEKADAALASLARMREALEDAPHGGTCQAMEWRTGRVDEDGFDVPNGPCDCWKAKLCDGKAGE